MEGDNRSARTKTWQDLARSEMHIWLLGELERYDVGYNEVEEFCLGLKYNFKSMGNQKNDDVMIEVVRLAMKIKLGDEKKYQRELIKERNNHRRDLQKKLGRNTKPYRKEIRDLRDAAAEVRDELRKKYEKKVDHLRGKYRQDKDDKDDEIPAELGEYYNLSIFSRTKFDEVIVDDYEIKCLGELNLHENEKKVLKLHTKFVVMKRLDETEMKIEQELSYTKARFSLREREEKMEEEMEMTEDEKKVRKDLQEMYRNTSEKKGGEDAETR